MDSLVAGFEPQLAIPVILVVVGAILVYMFGFKQTEEPSYEHLAVLQSTSTFHKTKSSSINNPKTGAGSNNTKIKANGHLPSSSSGANGVVKKGTLTSVNKENKPPMTFTSSTTTTGVKSGAQPQQGKKSLKDPLNKPEDFESGDWIPAVSRKDKSKQKQKDVPPSPGGGKRGNYNKTSNESSGSYLPIGLTASASAAPIVKAPKIEDLLAEMNVLKEIERQNTPPASPEKKVAVAATKVTTKVTAVKEETPKKVVAPKPAPVVVAQVVVEDEDEEVKVVPAAQEKKEKAPPAAPPKSNIAFDEMGGGDSWEEAKSRGAKKRTRARKD